MSDKSYLEALREAEQAKGAISPDAYDVPRDQPVPVLEALHKNLDEMFSLEEGIEQLEADLAAAKKSHNRLKSVDVPDLMKQLGMESLKRNGWEVKIETIVSGNLPKDPERREVALDWLEEHDGSELIKSEVSVTFGREALDAARELATRLKEEGLTASFERSVHAQTLGAYARERLKAGEPLDIEVLNLYVGEVAKAKKVKPKK